MSNTTPEHGEVWEDTEGCLMTMAGPKSFWAFGVDKQIKLTDPNVAHPIRRVFTTDGSMDEDFAKSPRLRYPNESAFR